MDTDNDGANDAVEFSQDSIQEPDSDGDGLLDGNDDSSRMGRSGSDLWSDFYFG